MMQHSSVTQEPTNPFSLVSKKSPLLFNYSNSNFTLDAHSSLLSNYLYFDSRGKKDSWNIKNKSKPVCLLSLSSSSKSASSRISRGIFQFNEAIRFHCEKIPLGFASVGGGIHCGESNGVGDEGNVVESEGVPNNGVELEMPKKVLILMSDTGGGHRASAEAIRAAFNEEFGDKYQVFITDLWTEHTPWPFNQLPRSYNFLVKHGSLWRMTYYATAPRVVHQTNFAATSTFIAREVAKGLMKYQPDIIISVHPLMQHVPLRILRSKGLLKKIIFTTVVTDLSTCHPTWFHKLVTRCYSPSEEVAKRALKAGLNPSQIKVYGLPVRPSFVKPVPPKVELRKELGMEHHLPAVLLMGGGEGMGPIEATARALGDALYDETIGEPIGQVLVICGRNKKLFNRLNSVHWKVPVQEAGNVPYVIENGCGKYSKSPKKIANIVAQWFGPRQDELRMMSQNALRLARPDAVFKIVHDMHELVRQKNFVPQYCPA
ncbi:probable monogalactosyldiacylglycerol synthase, chloroplastic isoform X3 [Capsicum annuum]|uniref:probable monogalactosyldiacylglycerol synthase, chloroplastic isoform X3 n=1 Tax=Capsicum annuum TaxID=4072 RepID=UPI001FB160C2|nr:probable monogalactosyldiacylglycerol synthase, chloroplastic isoform X3 [Capsicum annuum]